MSQSKKKVKRPHVICHMLQSVDGRTDATALARVSPKNEYDRVADKLDGDAWICGRVTMERDFAEGLFRETPEGAGTRSRGKRTASQAITPGEVHIADAHAKSYAISVDAEGKLAWESGDLDGDHLICAVGTAVPPVYLEVLRARGISYVVCDGGERLDFGQLLELLRSQFGIRRLVLSGGGHLNGAWAAAGLIDEVSVVIAPGIDGRPAVSSSYDGVDGDPESAGGESGFRMTELKLDSVKERDGGCLWLRYTVVRPASAAGRGGKKLRR